MFLALNAHQEKLKKAINSGDLFGEEKNDWQVTLTDNIILVDKLIDSLKITSPYNKDYNMNLFKARVQSYLSEQEDHQIKRSVPTMSTIKCVASWCIKFAEQSFK